MSARDVIAEAVAEEKQTEIGSPVAELVIQRLLSAGYVIERGWQPIETAPRDGLIDIWAHDRRYAECYHDSICDEWRTSRPTGHLHCIKARFATLWRPLPTPPEETSDAP